MPSGCMLSYVSGTGGTTVMLDDADAALVGTGAAIRGYEWSYELSGTRLTGASRAAREASVSCWLAASASEAAQVAFDADVQMGTPGALVSGEWSQRAYVTKAELSDVYADGSCSATLTVVLLDGVWRRETTYQLLPDSGRDVSAETLDYPHDYAHDYGGSTAAGVTIDVPGATPCDLRLTVYGHAVSPYVRIGANTYQVNVTVPEGAILTVDTTRKGSMLGDSVVLRGQYGDVQDVFSKRLRGAEGSGSYIYELVPPGPQVVSWPQSFGVDVTLVERRGALPWTSF